jgi:hypothetical protein
LGGVWVGILAAGAQPEAWVLSAVLFGYVVGNRGFAQISLTGSFPLLCAEAALLLLVPALFIRAALRRTLPFRADPLNLAILLWLTLGTARLPADIHTHGVIALRDFATLYYAAFFFVAQAIAANDQSERVLRRMFQGAILILPVSYFASNVASDLVFKIQIRGIPVFFYKEDLVAAALFSGFFVLLSQPVTRRLAWWRWPAAAACYASAFSIGSSRAGIAGLLVTLGWWGLGRRWRPFKLQAAIVPAGLAALFIVAVVQQKEFKQSKIYGLYEHVASMVDLTGTRRYTNPEQEFVGDNNRFRLAWWRSVAEEMWAVNPVFGVGFGYDITTPFVRNYEFDLGEDFTTRSPHSIFMTVFGRMGLVGGLAWLAILGCAANQMRRLLLHGRNGHDISGPLGWWSVSWVYLTSACFGVVLEGPMGAVVFWSALGIAYSRTAVLLEAAADETALTDETHAATEPSGATPRS